jgi:hypothetical protein
MSGSAISIANADFMGIRVASCEFTPEHSINGKNYSAKLTLSAYVNSRGYNGAEGKRDIYSFTIWGKLAHTCAKSMSRGKEFSCETRPNTYQGKVFHNRQPVQAPDGSGLLMTKKTSFTIRRLVFGEESNKHIQTEIQAGLRPVGWNVPGSPEEAQWKETLKSRQAVQFNPQAATYGYAKVRLPEGNYQPYIAKDANTAQAGVQATFAGVNPATPAATPATTPAPAQAPVVSEGGFVVPGV